MKPSLIKLIEDSIRQNWDLKALTDFNGETLQYKDVARKIEKLHLMMEAAGIRPGDKIALCGRNSSNWYVAFLATLTYGAVIVPILHEFKPDNIHNIVNHSEARLLFVGDQVWENLNENSMPALEGILCLRDFTLTACRSDDLDYARRHLNELFGRKYPKLFTVDDVGYPAESSEEEVAVINYTSGTTGFSKGVMLPYRSLLSNILFCRSKMKLRQGDNMVSMLPMGHVFGMTADFLYGITQGAHLFFLTRMPSPKIIINAVAQVHPRIIACVPLVIEKIVKKEILPRIDNKIGKLLLRLPIINEKIKERVREESIRLFGENLQEIVVGGASFNAEVEAFLRKIKFPCVNGYGMTECGPFICYSPWEESAYTSCGRAADRMEVRVISPDPQRIPGELICRGTNNMLGYYKNPEATAQVIDKDGWLHTGDMAVISESGHVYIKGRCKNMLLSSSGQNIYPEEIEAKLNNMPFVNESLVVMSREKLVALVYPDFDEALRNGFDEKKLAELLDQSRTDLNRELPAYSQLTRIVLQSEEFEKTAKKSIKRYLYQQTDI